MKRKLHIALSAMVMTLLVTADIYALPRSAGDMRAIPKKQFDVKMLVNQVDLGESFEVEIAYTSEECSEYKNILSEMRNSRVKKLDEDFFQTIGLSSQVFAPFIRIYEKTRLYSFELMLGLLKKKGIADPLAKLAVQKQHLIKSFIATGEASEEQLDQLSGQERDIYGFLSRVFDDYIKSGNQVLSQEFHFQKLERFLLKEIHNTCENKNLLTRLN